VFDKVQNSILGTYGMVSLAFFTVEETSLKERYGKIRRQKKYTHRKEEKSTRKKKERYTLI
jgi:hypothetical protein